MPTSPRARSLESLCSMLISIKLACMILGFLINVDGAEHYVKYYMEESALCCCARTNRTSTSKLHRVW
jgi:hypothetical protein